MNVIKCSLVLVAVTIFSFACGQSPTKPTLNTTPATNAASSASTPSPLPAVKDSVAIAADLYTVNCMACHKDSGKGGKVTVDGKNLEPDDLTSNKIKKRTDDKLFSNISDGAEDEGMPAFKDKLKVEEIRMLVGHLRALQSK